VLLGGFDETGHERRGETDIEIDHHDEVSPRQGRAGIGTAGEAGVLGKAMVADDQVGLGDERALHLAGRAVSVGTIDYQHQFGFDLRSQGEGRL
jgi:hypothetical protein